MEIIYEDNHIIAVNKRPGEIVQGDKTGDEPLSETLKAFIKERDCKPGNVFVGVAHRLDRPVGGIVLFAKTSKALTRLNEMFRTGKVHKRYWALTRNVPEQEHAELTHYITSTQSNNKSYASTRPNGNAKEARLRYTVLGHSNSFCLMEVELLTGRKHQIRVQLSTIGCPIRGDLKYGDRRSNPDGSISLLAHEVDFIHPVSKKHIRLIAPLPSEAPWQAFAHIHQQYQSTIEAPEDSNSGKETNQS